MDISTDRSKVEQMEAMTASDREYEYKLERMPVLIAIFRFLYLGSTFGLFIYTSSMLLISLSVTADRNVFNQQTSTFSCNQYYCNQAAYNFVTYYTWYQDCNTRNCANIVCSGYECSANQDTGSLNLYYACQTNCGAIDGFPTPDGVFVGYGLAIAAAVCFGIFWLVAIIQSVYLLVTSSGLLTGEKVGIALTFMCPSVKWYQFRLRKNWKGVWVNFKLMILMDYASNFFFSITTGIYIAFLSFGFWLTAVEVTTFFFMIFSNYMLWTSTGLNASLFWRIKERMENFRDRYI